jgi:PAS domain S-box-containing protein
MERWLVPPEFSIRFAHEVCGETGKAFFDALVCFLAQALEADCAVFADPPRGVGGEIRLISTFPANSLPDSLGWDPAVSDWLRSGGDRVIASELEKESGSPATRAFAAMRFKQCLTLPLLGSQGQPVGLVHVLHKTTPEKVDSAKAMLGSILGRVSREAERIAEQRLIAGEKKILEMLARNAPLDQTLGILVRTVEEQACRMLCSILLLDRDGLHLHTGVAPSLPEDYSRALDGLKIGPDAGACGRAAYLRERVVCADIAGDSLWGSFRETLLRHNLRACWSTPIISGRGAVLGTFASYYTEPRAPHAGDLSLVDRVIDLAQLAIEQRRTEEERWESDKKLRLLDYNTTEVILAYDMERHLTYVNPAVEQQTGYSVEEMRARQFINWVHPEDSARMMDLWERLYQGEGYSGVEFRIITKEGNVKWILGTWGPMMDESGRQIGVQGREIDITERKRLEEQLRQSQKMEAVGQLAGGVAHDFNNLLTAILGHCELLLQGLDDADPVRVEIDEIRMAGERAALLTRQLLAFSRKQVLQPVILDLSDLLDKMSKMLRRLIREDIRLVTAGRSGLWLVKADPGQMQQVILNLALNARDAMPQGGSLAIRVSNVTLEETQLRGRAPMKPGQYVKLSVLDTGEGMDETTRARIFEPFFTTKELGKGTGLGLSTVYGIIKQSDGFIYVESQSGKGTTFEIYLPRVEESLESPRTEAPPPPVAESRTILVVEDDDAVRRPIRRMLEVNGYQVLEAHGADEALQIVRQESGRIDLVLTDIVMPRMSGRELANRLAVLHPSIRILYMSGHVDDPTVMEATDKGSRSFIQKPFSGSVLARKVQQILDRPKG